MSKNKSIRAQGYDVLFCYDRNGEHTERKLTTNPLGGGLWLALQTMLRMGGEIEAEFYDHVCMPIKSHVRLIAYDQYSGPLVLALMALEHKSTDKPTQQYVLRHHRTAEDEKGVWLSNHDAGLFLALYAISRKCRDYECNQRDKGGYLTLNREEKGKKPFDKLMIIVGV